MTCGAYYNEIDPFAAQWLRNLIAAGHIAPGDVDERSILDVRADDLRGYRQCHFFAGIGVWSYALRQAGWSDDEEVWTGSCPCQPFSDAGRGGAFDDERDLWPAFFNLIRERRPVVVAGEQVASRLGLAWLDALHADLEGEAYTVGAVDTCSAGFGSPNIRQRLYWMAHSGRGSIRYRRQPLEGTKGGNQGQEDEWKRLWSDVGDGGDFVRMADAAGPERRPQHIYEEDGRYGQDGGRQETHGKPGTCGQVLQRPGPVNGLWRAADWLCCTDGKWRPVEPGTFPLVAGATARLGRLRAFGNAINAQVAVEFLRACRHELKA